MPPLLLLVHKESFDTFFSFWDLYFFFREAADTPSLEGQGQLGRGSDQHVEGVPARGRGLELNDPYSPFPL